MLHKKGPPKQPKFQFLFVCGIRDQVKRLTANQRSDLLVTLAFLWGPGVLVVALAIHEITGINLLVPALLLAGAPYVAVVVWPFAVAFKEGGTLRRAAILLGLILFAALAVKLSWGPPPEY